ncbi:MAG: ABC transporter substrate-binding protein [Chloroflexota bacterium]|nr:ABC transporter substrate-binding protein [Chloroflexota bacterium]
MFNKKWAILATVVMIAMLVLPACQPTEVEKIVKETVVVKETEVVTVKETEVVEVTAEVGPSIDEMLDTVGVKAVDDYTVEFTIEYPAGFFPAIAGMWVARPVPQWAIEEYGDRWTDPGFIPTNGAYVMTEWIHDDHIILEKNPYYYDADGVQIDRVEGVMIVEDSTGMAMYENNELDTYGGGSGAIPTEDMDRVQTDPVLSQEFTIYPSDCTYYYGFTTTKPPVDDPLVRKALGAAIDRQGLIDTVLKSGQQPANAFANPLIFGNVAFDPDVCPWCIDYEMGKAKAQEWLAEAGYPNGEGWPTDVVLMHNTSEGHKKIAEFIQANWREVLGIEVNVENQEWKVYLQTVQKETPIEDAPHIWRMGWCADYPDQNNWVHEVFNPTAGANRTRQSADDPYVGDKMAEFDELTRAAGQEQDPDTRKEMYKTAEKLLVEEIAAMTPIYYYTGPAVSKPWLTRLQRGIGGNHFALWSIDWETKKAATGATGDAVTMNWNFGTEPPTADPALATDTTSVDLDEALFLGLTDFDDVTSEVIPELATDWAPSEDGLTWTFNLRDDVYWVRYDTATKTVEQVLDDEGNPRMVTAYDIEYAVKRTLDPRTASDYAYVLYIIKNGEAVNTMSY